MRDLIQIGGSSRTSPEGSFRLRFRRKAGKDTEDNYSRRSVIGLEDGKNLAYSRECQRPLQLLTTQRAGIISVSFIIVLSVQLCIQYLLAYSKPLARFIECIKNELTFLSTIHGIILSTGIAWMKDSIHLFEVYLITLNYSDCR